MAADKQFVCARSYSALYPCVGDFLRSAADAQETLLIAPSRGAADDLARLCCSAGVMGLHRMTLNQLAAELAAPAMAVEGKAPASRLAMEAICARVAHELLKDARISYFAPVARTPGFSRALAATLSELRLQNVEPAALESAGAPGADLSALLALYEKKLNEAGLADLSTLLRFAAAAAQQGEHRFAGAALILLDPPIDSALTRDFLAAFAPRAPRLLALALTGDDKGIETLERIVGTRAEDSSTTATARLDRVRRSLFLPQAPESGEMDESVCYFSSPGEGMECIEIARRIRKLAGDGVPFDRVAVLLRDPDRYQPSLEEALRRARIPGYFTRGVVRPHPGGRAFLALLRCAQDGCSASRFGEYLSLGQVPAADSHVGTETSLALDDELLASFSGLPEERDVRPPPDEGADETSPVIDGTLQSPSGWEDLLVDAAVIGGLDRWERRLAGLEAELKLQLSELDESAAGYARAQNQIERLKNLQRFAIPLVRRLHALPASGIWSEWIEALSELARAGLRQPEPVLSLLSELESMGEVGPVGLDEVMEALSERLRFLRREPDTRRYGRVFVSSIDEARGRSFDVVFLPGLAEGLFPRKMMEDPLLLDAYRPSPLSTQDDRVQQERLLLRRAVASASTRLIFSYPRVDAVQSRPRVPSLYALEILRAALGKLPELRDFEKRAAESAQARLDWPAPRSHNDAIDDAEYDLVSLEQKKNGARGSMHYLVEKNAALGRSLRARAWRWMRNKWSYADGLVVDSDDAARAAAAAYKLTARSYSATALQQFAACPYRFLLHGIHQLHPRETPVALEQMDPLTRGGLFHAVQRELFVELQSAGLLPVDRERLNPIRDAADRALDRVAARYEENLAPAIPRVWRSEVEEIRTDLHGWLGSIASDDQWLPAHFELGFGLASGTERDPASREEEVTLAGGARLRGSIDLVERHQTRGTLRVIDHKTGKPPERPPAYVGGGLALQPLLYALAVEQMLGKTVESSELFYCTQRGNYLRIEAETTAAARRFLGRALEIIGSAIEDGFLPAAPQDGACALCDYKPVCGPHEAQRVKRKNPDRLETLAELRIMP